MTEICDDKELVITFKNYDEEIKTPDKIESTTSPADEEII